MKDPLIYTRDGAVYCDRCIGEEANHPDVGATGFPWDDMSEWVGATCDRCGACFVDGEWWPHDHANDRKLVRWSRCSSCNAQRPYSRLSDDCRDVRVATLAHKRVCRCCGEKTERFE
jgi:hypothetical protein